MARIVLAAENFAFGPAGKLLTIVPALVANGHHLEFVGFGTAFDLASRQPETMDLHEVDTTDEARQDTVNRIIGGADLVISCMDAFAIISAKRMGVPCVWIDSLFYWWETLPDEVLTADLFIKQDVLSDDSAMNKYASRIPNLLPVGPIVSEDPSPSTPSDKKRTLICLGGMDAPGWYIAGANHNYPFTVMELIDRWVRFDDADEVVVTGSSGILERLAAKYRGSRYHFTTLPHEAFVRDLRTARFALLAGGLESSLECFRAGTPALFLPPLNVTHHLQVAAFRAAGAAPASIHFSDYFPAFDWAHLTRREKVDDFLNRLRQFEASAMMKKDAGERINSWIQDDRDLYSISRAQAVYFGSLKRDGLSSTVGAIEKVLAGERAARPMQVKVADDN